MNKVPLEKIMTDCKKCNKNVKVKDVAEVFEESIAILYNTGSILKRIEKKIGEDDFNGLITSIMATFLSTIYANAQFDSVEESIAYGSKINATSIGIKKGE